MSAPTRYNLPLKGSSKLVAEFFEYSINSILYQRGIYPAEDFTTVRKYDLNMLVTIDSEVKAYIKKIMAQLHRWLVKGKITKLVIAITSKETGETVERWEFGVEVLAQEQGPEAPEKPQEEIQKEIQSIIRQLTASVTFLPELEGRCTFNVLVYADGDADVPPEWADGDPRMVENGEEVKLRSFSTQSHRIDTMVAYKLGV
ncbi:mitotic spindle checkpoint component Mad2p [Trichomonascus vanleenenianus]|uniref:spindle checkpoint protein MAD2 n=1 Tax=Trichomonascus vanleenenianus TaxID=2268995 RepID=UPI003ECA73A5